jgi:hypothetical protein
MNIELTNILKDIKNNFQTGKKIPAAYYEHVLNLIKHDILPRYAIKDVSNFRKVINILENSIHRGIEKDYFLLLISELFNEFKDDNVFNESLAIIKLDKQIRNLKNQLNSSGNFESQLNEIKEQIEDLKTQNDEKNTQLIEKQEDILQKFLKADKKAFIIMPFQKEFDNVWFGAIKPACKDEKYASLRVDEVNLSSLITDDIEKYSTMADVVIVDLTGNNANVMFELGFALAKDKKPIVICQGEHTNKISFDVRGIRHISYENSWLGIEELKKKIKEYISATDKQIKKKAIRKKTKKEESNK